MKCHFFIFAVFASFFYNSTFSQEFLNTNPLNVEKDSITEQNIQKQILNNKVTFKAKDINQLKIIVEDYNTNIYKELNILENTRQEIIAQRQLILQNKSSIKLQLQINEAKSNYLEIENDLKKSISEFSNKALYVYVAKDIDVWENPENLIRKATVQLTPVAIESVRGSLISSISELYKKEGEEDVFTRCIRDEVSGQVKVDKKINHKLINSKAIFWYLCQLDVAPLHNGSELKENIGTEKQVNTIMINALKDSNVYASLIKNGIPESIATDINKEVLANLEQVELKNLALQENEYKVVKSANERLYMLSKKIEEMEFELNASHAVLRKLIENNTHIKYASDSVEHSITKANQALLLKIEENLQKEKELRQRLLYAEWERQVATSGSPVKAIASNTFQIKGQMEVNYGKIEQFLSVKEMYNDDFSMSISSKQLMTQKIDKLWFYPQAQKSGWVLSVITRFSFIDDEKPDLIKVEDQAKEKENKRPLSTSDIIIAPIDSPIVFPATNAKVLLELVPVKGGSFEMGCTHEQVNCQADEKPVHTVILNDYLIGKYEVSCEQYILFLNSINATAQGFYKETLLLDFEDPYCPIRYTGNEFVFKASESTPGIEYPVTCVTWYGADLFCKWVSFLTHTEFRLPTEAEWEYAARGGNPSVATIYSGGNNPDDLAWYNSNSENKLHIGGQKKPNDLSVFDMSGNISEWCADWYDKMYYSNAPMYNPVLSAIENEEEAEKVFRGGSWNYQVERCRVAYRNSEDPNIGLVSIGFRVAGTAKK